MNKKIKALLEYSAVGGIILFVATKVISILDSFIQNELYSLIICTLIAGLFTGYELKNDKIKISEIVLSALLASFFFALIGVLFNLLFFFNLSQIFGLLTGFLIFPFFFIGELLSYKLCRNFSGIVI